MTTTEYAHSPMDGCGAEPIDWERWSQHSLAVASQARREASQAWTRRDKPIRSRISHGWQVFRRVMRALRQLATDKRVPRWLRILLIIGCIQIPVLPIDEIALIAALIIIGIWYRQPLRDALATARGRTV